MDNAVIVEGVDNQGKSRQDYANWLATLNEADLFTETEMKIWLSAYAHNKPRSDYHWHADTCYDEAQRRGLTDLYKKAWHKASGIPEETTDGAQ